MDFSKRKIKWLFDAPQHQNIANDLSEAELGRIANEVVRNYELDKMNRKEWDDQSERALKLAKQVLERKSTPWVGASNVKHPLITIATIQFAARAYPEICKTNRVVKTTITGDDKPDREMGPQPGVSAQGAMPAAPSGVPPGGAPLPVPLPQPGQKGQPGMQTPVGPASVTPPPQPGPKQLRANRIEAHMNWQLTQEQSDWEADMDTLLHVLPVVGQCYKKSYFSAQDRHNISELVLPNDCFVSKGRSRDIKKARRISHRLWIYENEAIEKMRSGVWKTIELGQAPTADSDTDAPHEFIEQHCYFDLDGDGYKEPWIITIHFPTSRVVRVAARFISENVIPSGKNEVERILPDHYFTHYGFIPNPDGSINYLGFGQLLEPINASANTTLNQLLDAGHLYNAGGGFVGRGVRMRGGTYAFKPGEWKLVDVQGGALKDNIIPMPVREPSAVLFQLLGFLVNSGKEIASISDILSGDTRLAASMPVGTAMALVEQGLKVYTGIYKRVYRSLTEEFRKIYKLNARFLEPKVSFSISGHPEQFIGIADYQAGDTSVMPVADPELSSDMQRLLKSQALKELSGRPGLNEIEVSRRLVQAIRPENIDAILLTDGQITGQEPSPWKPPQSPQQVLAQAKALRMQQQAQEANMRLQMDMVKFQLELQELEDKIANTRADTLLKLANASDKAVSDDMEVYKIELDRLAAETKMKVELLKASLSQLGKMAPPGQEGGMPPGMPELPPQAQPGAPPSGMIPGRQAGGPVQAGQPYVVGEGGPEVVAPGGAPSGEQPFWYDELTFELERGLH